MPLTPRAKEQVIATATDLLRHRQRRRLMDLLQDRVDRGDYDDDEERRLDRIALSIARAIDAQLEDDA